MDKTNINIININQMFNSAIQQSVDGSSINITKEEAAEVANFLESINTEVPFLKVKNAYINGLGNANKLASKYFEELIIELKKHEVKTPAENNRDKAWAFIFISELANMSPLKNKIIDFLIMVFENADDTTNTHEYFKKLLQVLFDEFEYFQNKNNWGYIKSDHFRIVVYDIFLNICNYLVKNEKLQELSFLLNSNYQVKCISESQSSSPRIDFNTVSFIDFNMSVFSVNDASHRSQNNLGNWDQRNLYAELLRDNNNSDQFNEIVNTDILLFFISLFWRSTKKSSATWIPHTSMLRKDNTSELMLKCKSKSYFDKVLEVFNLSTSKEFFDALPNVLQLKSEIQNHLQNHNLPESDFALYYHFINNQA